MSKHSSLFRRNTIDAVKCFIKLVTWTVDNIVFVVNVDPNADIVARRRRRRRRRRR